MFEIMNSEFIKIKVESIQDKNNKSFHNLISIFTDPEDFELPQYLDTPFACIEITLNENMNSWEKDRILKELRSHNYVIHSMYKTNDDFDSITDKYSDSNKYPTLIFRAVNGTKENQPMKNIVLLSMPCSGIVRDIGKSKYFKLYNAGLVSMKGRPFKWKDEFYDKLVYCLIDIDSHFQFVELLYTDSPDDIRMAYLHQITLNIELDKGSTRGFNIAPVYKLQATCIQCEYSEERNELFQYFGKNIFKLSDIPNNITKRGMTITSRIK